MKHLEFAWVGMQSVVKPAVQEILSEYQATGKLSKQYLYLEKKPKLQKSESL